MSEFSPVFSLYFFTFWQDDQSKLKHLVVVSVAVNPWMYRQLSLYYFNTEENPRILSYNSRLFSITCKPVCGFIMNIWNNDIFRESVIRFDSVMAPRKKYLLVFIIEDSGPCHSCHYNKCFLMSLRVLSAE